MKSISNSTLFRIYFNTPPYLLAEVSIAVIVIFLIANPSTNNYLASPLFFAIPIYIIYKKVRSTKLAKRLIAENQSVTGHVISEMDAGYENNEKAVKSYTIEYIVNGKSYTHIHSSAYARHLKNGMPIQVYYDKLDPQINFMPSIIRVKV